MKGYDELLDFEDFKDLAKDKTLTRHEKIHAPNYVREGYNEVIIKDITSKLPEINGDNNVIIDIGCGCDDMSVELTKKIINNKNVLYLLDSAEMLALMPNNDLIHKIPGKFPEESENFIEQHKNIADAMLMYSMLQYVCVHDSIFNFIDKALELLKPGGKMLLGDLPNRSKRRRFFASNKGIKTHQEYTKTNEIPKVDPWEIEYAKLDDSMIFAILQRYRAGGHETYILPQGDDLPFATRREDILIVKRS